MSTKADTVTPTPPFDDPCIVHRPMTFHGGGEAYVFELARALDAPIYTSVCEIDIPSDVSVTEFGRNGRLADAVRDGPFNDFTTTLAYENFAVPERHDAVVTSGDVAISVIHLPEQRRYHVFHGAVRWLYNRAPGQFVGGLPGVRFVKQIYQSAMRLHYQSATSRVDDFLPTSEIIGRELETYHDRKHTAVMYPPVETNNFYHGSSEDYLLYVGRLEERKRVDQIVEAINGTDYRLEVAGTGEEEQRLRGLADENVTFHGFVSEERKVELLARCRALVFNSEREPFGIVPVEAFASGKPVVGVNEGFTALQVEDGVNGVAYDRGVESLRDAVDRAFATEWDPDRIQRTAEPYDVESFTQRWREVVYGT